MEVGKSTGYIIHGWVWVGMEIWYITLYRVGGTRGSQKMIIFRYIICARPQASRCDRVSHGFVDVNVDARSSRLSRFITLVAGEKF